MDDPLLKKLKTDNDGLDLCKDAIAVEEEDQPEKMSQFVLRQYPEIGITEYMSQHTGFSAVVKERYSDFIVHEIDKDGQIVKLTDMSVPKVKNIPSADQEAVTYLQSVAGKDVYDSICALHDNPRSKESIEIDVSEMDKEARTRIHKAINQLFPGMHHSTDNDRIGIRTRQQGRDNRREWPHPHAHTHFTLYQENRGTGDSLARLSKCLRVNAKSFQFAGLKDKRGISSQRISHYKLDPHRLIKANSELNDWQNRIAVGNISFEPEPLRLGQLKGNHFQMVLRDVVAENDQDVEAALKAVQENGFINYFGTQRFGTGSVRTDRIGCFILKKDWKAAIDAILSPKFRDDFSETGSYNELMKLWHATRDAEEVLNRLPPKFRKGTEGYILTELTRDPNNYMNALLAVSRNSRYMYLHAYQSIVFNRLASWRIKEHGLNVVPGDLVGNDQFEDGDSESDGRVLGVTIVTNENVPNYTLEDIVLPIPGHKTAATLPADCLVMKRMEEIMAEDGITLSSFDEIRDSFMSFGGYRKLMARAEDMTWSTVTYTDKHQQLLRTDWEELQNVELPEPIPGDKKAVIMEFRLPSSSYATICCREIMKR